MLAGSLCPKASPETSTRGLHLDRTDYKRMIYNCIPYGKENQSLGGFYNEFMSLIGIDDWACFIDHDAMHTTEQWFQAISAAVAQADPNVGMFTCMTNRVGNFEQIVFPKKSEEANIHDIRFHRMIGTTLLKKHYAGSKKAVRPISGLMMLISKKAWLEVGGFEEGFLAVDNKIHATLEEKGYEVRILKGIYLYHWYRAEVNPKLQPIGY